MRAIAAIGAQPDAMKVLEDALHDKSPQVRQSAAAVLNETDDEIAFTAAKALSSMGDISGQRFSGSPHR
ncbi:MAG: hypothetical protein DMG57_19605 [Acidobacteria bacterium]|nr:MAG: hypothetical protein DMG57_19605 [Acidobacteriota bacterium]